MKNNVAPGAFGYRPGPLGQGLSLVCWLPPR